MTVDEATLVDRISYHRPSDEGVNRIAEMRHAVLGASRAVAEFVPEGREQSLAFTKLEEALFWANAGIARHPDFQAVE